MQASYPYCFWLESIQCRFDKQRLLLHVTAVGVQPAPIGAVGDPAWLVARLALRLAFGTVGKPRLVTSAAFSASAVVSACRKATYTLWFGRALAGSCGGLAVMPGKSHVAAICAGRGPARIVSALGDHTEHTRARAPRTYSNPN
jgi:hypothetical protein